MKHYTTLLSVSELFRHITNPDWAIIDCRFSLDDIDRSHREYLHTHIPGAIYAHLGKNLSGHIIPGKTGSHPLPEPKTFARTLSNWGIDDNVQVVAYDDKGARNGCGQALVDVTMGRSSCRLHPERRMVIMAET